MCLERLKHLGRETTHTFQKLPSKKLLGHLLQLSKPKEKPRVSNYCFIGRELMVARIKRHGAQYEGVKIPVKALQ